MENTITINGKEYVEKDSVEKEVIKIGQEDFIGSDYVGKYVICRSGNEGINFGKVLALDETGVVMKECQRLHHHRPEDKNLSWYEGVAVSGLGEDSVISGPADKVIVERYSLTLCSQECINSIKAFVPNAQS